VPAPMRQAVAGPVLARHQAVEKLPHSCTVTAAVRRVCPLADSREIDVAI